MRRLLLAFSFVAALLFAAPHAFALTLDNSAYYDNEPVMVTGITNGTSNNLWLYPFELAADCRYYGTYNCATGNSTRADNLPLAVQNDTGSSPAEQTFGTAVILGNGTYTLVETSSATDCGGLDLAACQVLETDEVVFTMATSGGGGGGATSSLVITDQTWHSSCETDIDGVTHCYDPKNAFWIQLTMIAGFGVVAWFISGIIA